MQDYILKLHLPNFLTIQPWLTVIILSVFANSCLFVFFLLRLRDIIQHLSFYVWITSLSIMPSRFIYMVANGKMFFFFMAEIYIYIFLYIHICIFSPCIHLSIDDPSAFFHILLIVNNAVIYTWVCRYILEILIPIPSDTSIYQVELLNHTALQFLICIGMKLVLLLYVLSMKVFM